MNARIYLAFVLFGSFVSDTSQLTSNQTEYHFKDNAPNCQNSYTLFMQKKTFWEAVDHCQQNGGVLAPQSDRVVNALAASVQSESLGFVWMRGNCFERRMDSHESQPTKCSKKNAVICKKVLAPDTRIYINDDLTRPCPGHGNSIDVVDSKGPNKTFYWLKLEQWTFKEARKYCKDLWLPMVNMRHDSLPAIDGLIKKFWSLCPQEKRLSSFPAVWDDGTCMGKNLSDAGSYSSDDCSTPHPFVCTDSKGDVGCLPENKKGYSFKTLNHSYLMLTEKKSHLDAKDHCKRIGGQLAPLDKDLKKALEEYVNCKCIDNKWESGPLWVANYTDDCVAYFKNPNGYHTTVPRLCDYGLYCYFVCKNNSSKQSAKYQLFKKELSFWDATRHCEKNGGTLASLDTDKEAILSKAKDFPSVIIWNTYHAMAISNPKSEVMGWSTLPSGKRNGFICKMD